MFRFPQETKEIDSLKILLDLNPALVKGKDVLSPAVSPDEEIILIPRSQSARRSSLNQLRDTEMPSILSPASTLKAHLQNVRHSEKQPMNHEEENAYTDDDFEEDYSDDGLSLDDILNHSYANEALSGMAVSEKFRVHDGENQL